MTFAIGYYNRPNKKDFVIIAETMSEAAAFFIRDAYNDGYRRAGITTRVEIVRTAELDEYRY